jgi:predicted methyltransferase
MSPIVRALPEAPNVNMKAILLTVIAVLSFGCKGESASPGPDPAHTSGAEHALPETHEYAERLDDAAREKWQKPAEVIALLDCPEAGTVVDLGAGTGYFLRGLSQAVGPNGRVLALDAERSMVERMYDRVDREGLRNVRPDVIPTDDPSLTPRSVDRVLIVNTWHHIEARPQYAAKLQEALRPGGMVLVVDFTAESPIGPPAARRLTIDTVRAELEAGGMTAEVLEESLPYQYVVAGRVP